MEDQSVVALLFLAESFWGLYPSVIDVGVWRTTSQNTGPSESPSSEAFLVTRGIQTPGESVRAPCAGEQLMEERAKRVFCSGPLGMFGVCSRHKVCGVTTPQVAASAGDAWPKKSTHSASSKNSSLQCLERGVHNTDSDFKGFGFLAHFSEGFCYLSWKLIAYQ